jgi:hypothetical protein
MAQGERSISEHFSGLLTTERVRQELQRRGFRATDKYNEYHSWFAKQVGIRPKAMDMFNQTVAVKDIQGLNKFIREHMLEATPWSERLDKLQAHFTQLTEAHAALVRVRKQFDLLQPIATKGEIYSSQALALSAAQKVMRVLALAGKAPANTGEQLGGLSARDAPLGEDARLRPSRLKLIRERLHIRRVEPLSPHRGWCVKPEHRVRQCPEVMHHPVSFQGCYAFASGGDSSRHRRPRPPYPGNLRDGKHADPVGQGLQDRAVSIGELADGGDAGSQVVAS